MALTPGSRLGPYEIVAAIGSGGMGDVYRAYGARLDRFVAIKVLPDTVRDDPERRERFEREARAIAALNHPNIVTIHSVERAGDMSFLTMELVEGKPLTSVIPRAGLPLDRVLSIMIPVVDGIAAAHQRGITHRDLKPANIMVGDGPQHGRVKVLDFGLAKVAGTPLASDGTTALPTALATVRGGFWAPSPTWRLNRRKGSRLTADRICSRSA
jgi:serine/threonine protein kinase